MSDTSGVNCDVHVTTYSCSFDLSNVTVTQTHLWPLRLERINTR